MTARNRAHAFLATGAPVCPVTVSAPAPRAAARPAGSASFTVSATGRTPRSYHWQILTDLGAWQTLGADPGTLPCRTGAPAFATPLNAPAVAVGVRPCPVAPGPNRGAPQRFQVRCVVSNACGTATSAAVTYTVCPADYTCQHGIDLLDIFAFLSARFAGC